MKELILHSGREKSILQYHPWIFSGAVRTLAQTDDFVAVTSSNGKHLGYAYINPKSQIIARMVSFDETEPLVAIRANFKRAIELRNALIDSKTSARRLVNAEADFLPGLIIDQYGDAAVLQIATLGMERIKDFIVQLIKEELKCSWIVELSTSPARKQEGLKPIKQTIFGEAREEISVQEDGLKFIVSPLSGQKTGFFLDLSQMRKLIQSMSRGKRVLNLCSYTGAFSLHALKGGAQKVVSVDVSKEAISQTVRHVELNGFAPSAHSAHVEDVFAFVEKESLDYDIVILDPPAFAKQKKDVASAVKAYRELNRMVLSKLPAGSFLLSCSCSYHVDEPLFRKLLFQASASAKRAVQILQSHRLAFDHPLSIYHPEGSYLKSFLLHIH